MAMTIQERFELFHKANPHVYAMFKHFIKELLRAGHRRVSADFVMHRIRWEMMVPTTPTPGSGWHVAGKRPLKINNNFASRYARLFIAEYPAAEKLIELRKLHA